MKIEFAANGRVMDGWIGTDINTCDVRNPLPWPDNSVAEIFHSHLSEHLTSAECMRFFMECFRILKPDGVMRIIVPAINDEMTRHHIQDLCIGHQHFQTFSFINLHAMLFGAGFELHKIWQTEKKPIDNHHETIGESKDELESLRVEAIK